MEREGQEQAKEEEEERGVEEAVNSEFYRQESGFWGEDPWRFLVK